MTSVRFLIYCDEIHVKSTLKSGLCGRRSGKVRPLLSFGTIRLLPKFRTSDEMSHRETECTEDYRNKAIVGREAPAARGATEIAFKILEFYLQNKP